MIYPERIEDKLGFTPIREDVKELCVSTLGKDLVDKMKFDSAYDNIIERLKATDEMKKILSGDDTFPIGQLYDATPPLKSLVPPETFLPPKELMKVRNMILTIAEISAFFDRHRDTDDHYSTPYPTLDNKAIQLSDFPLLITSIDRIIDKYGNVKDNASPALLDIRKSLRSMAGKVNSIMRSVIARAVAEGLVEKDTAPSIRDGRLVLPVAPMNKRKVNGIVHDESASGKTIFIEPAEIVETNNHIRELEMEERHEIIRIMISIAREIRPEIPSILDSALILGYFDFTQAKALYAQQTGGCMPSIEPGQDLEWYHACHPVLKLTLERQGKEIIPLDITLKPSSRLLIISGPNAGGKSVCLKTVGTLQYMLQCGMLPPVYENSRFGLFKDILVDLGDDQSIEDDLSTYSSHLKAMKLFIRQGNESSLVLIDEFGGGTEPQIGGAIAQAILRQFNDRGMWGVITTHYQNLKQFAEDTDGLINGSMLYDRHLMQPMFKLSIGNPGSSFAIEIARKIGLPDAIIEEASAIVGSEYINLDKYLLDIARDKRYWENKRTAIRQKEKKIEALLEKYENDAETLRQSRREIIEDARRQADSIIASSNASIERVIHDIRRSQAEKEKTLEARNRLKEQRDKLAKEPDKPHPLLEKAPHSKKKNKPIIKLKNVPIEPGLHVRLDGAGTVGTVIKVNGKKAEVTFGLMKTTVDISRLDPTIAKPATGSGKASFISSATTDAMRTKQLNFKQEIDVRGMRVDEAIQAITYFIDDALQFESHRVRILHGTGTGALRQAIRQYLSSVPGVVNFHDEDVRLGGAGITVVNL